MYRLKRIFFLLSINIALLAGLIYFFSSGVFSFLNLYTSYNKSVCMPDLSSMTLEEAKAELEKLNLRYGIDDSFYDPIYEPNKILNFAPLAGEIVKENREVYLQINGNGWVSLPFIKGEEKTAALNAIFKANLNIKKFIYVPHKDKNKVIEAIFEGKIIEAEQTLPYQSKIDLVIGTAEEKEILIPDLRGLEFELASNLLKKYNFIQGEIHHKEDLSPFNLKIYKQYPLAGKSYELDQPIELWLSDLDSKELENLIDFYKKQDEATEEINHNFESIFQEDKDIIIE